MARIFTVFLWLSVTTLSLAQTFDATFKPIITSSADVTAMAKQADGKLLVAGSFSYTGSTKTGNILRLNADGTIDATFQKPVVSGFLSDLEIQADGKILLAGNFQTVNSSTRTGFARLNSDGTLDDTFNPALTAPFSSSAWVNGIGVQSDNQIVIQGYFLTVNGTSHPYIARLNADGSTDATFTTVLTVNSGSSEQQPVIVQPDGKILIAGLFTKVNDVAVNRFARLNANGSLDTDFATNLGTGPDDSVYGMGLQADGKIVIGGRFALFNGATQNRVARINSNGTIDSTFPTDLGFNSGNSVKTITVLADQKIMVGGNFQAPRIRVLRLNTNGTIDAGFNPGTGPTSPDTGDVRGIQMLGTNYVLGGTISYYNGTLRIGLVRVNTSGTIDTSLDLKLGRPGQVHATVVQTDGKVVIGGRFNYINGTLAPNIARLTSAGALDPYTQGVGFDDEVRALHVLATGKIMVGGFFDNYNNVSVPELVRLNTDGTRDNTFVITINTSFTVSGVYQIKAVPGNKLLIGGGFTQINSNNTKNLALINLDGSSDLSFVGDNLTSLWLTDVDVNNSGNIIATSTINSGEVFLLNPNGTIRTDFTLNSKLSTRPATAIFDTNGNIMFGGPSTNGLKMIFKTDFSSNYVPFNYQSTNTQSYVWKIKKHLNKYLIGRKSYYEGTTKSFEWVNESGQVLSNTIDTKGDIYDFLVSGSNLYISGMLSEVNGEPITGVIRVSMPSAPSGTPTLLAGTAQQGKVNLTWTDNSNNETGFDVYRSSNGGTSWSFVGTATGASYADNTVVAETAYQYYVEATNLSGNSSASNIFSITSVQDVPAAPSNLAITMEAQVDAKLTWLDNALNETEYRVYRSSSLEGGGYTLYKKLPASTTTFTDPLLVAGTTYGYIIRAHNSLGESAPSDLVTATFPHMTASWVNEPGATGIQRTSAAYFTIGNKGYVGTGRNASGNLKDFWEFDPATDTWTKKKDFPGTTRIGAVGFSINGKGYIGLGNDGSGAFKTDVYEYDPATDDWTPVADFPKDPNSDAGLSSAASFVIGNYGYVGLGNSGLSNVKTFMRYDPVANTWEAMAPFGGSGRPGAIGLSANGKGYFGLGGVGSKFSDLWEYTPSTNSWVQLPSLPGAARAGATAFMIQDQLYVGLGDAGDLFTENLQVNFYMYDVKTSGWSSIPNYTGVKRSGAVAFVINDTGYVGLGSAIVSSVTNYYDDIKSYQPVIALAPASPKDLAASLQTGPLKITLTWTDQSDNETAFVIERSVSTNPTLFTRIATVDANIATFADPDLIGGTIYNYRVASINAYGKRAYTATVTQDAALPPAAPSVLTAKGVMVSGSRAIELTWNDNSSNEQGFEVHTSEDGTVFTSATTATNKFVLSGLPPNKQYFFKVRAYNAGGTSAFTSVVSANSPPVEPAAPTALVAKSTLTFTTRAIELTWTDNADNEQGFEVYRSEDGNVFTFRANALSNKYTDQTLLPDKKYYYRIRAYNTGGTSVFTDVVSTFTQPAEPSALKVENSTTTSIRIAWADNSNTETSYNIYRAAGGSYTLLSTAPANTTSYTDETAVKGVLYAYNVKSVNSAGESNFAASANARLLPLPPGNFQLKYVGVGIIRLSWSIPSSGEQNFKIYRADNEGEFVLVSTVSASESFKEDVVEPSGVYHYKLKSVHEFGESEFSETKTIDITLLTGVEDEELALKFYPNPVVNTFEIRMATPSNYSYVVTDTKGSLITKGDFSGDAATIDISAVKPGIYLMQIQSEDERITKKIIKQ